MGELQGTGPSPFGGRLGRGVEQIFERLDRVLGRISGGVGRKFIIPVPRTCNLGFFSRAHRQAFTDKAVAAVGLASVGCRFTVMVCSALTSTVHGVR